MSNLNGVLSDGKVEHFSKWYDDGGFVRVCLIRNFIFIEKESSIVQDSISF